MRYSYLILTLGAFCLTGCASDDSLQGSIGRAGLIHPPKLLQTADGIIVLAGFRRVAACRALGWPRVPAHVFAEQDISASERCILAIADNTVNRPLNLVETAAAVRLLHDRLEDADAVRRALRALQMPTSTAWIDQQMAMASLPGFLHEALLAGVKAFFVFLLECQRFTAGQSRHVFFQTSSSRLTI